MKANKGLNEPESLNCTTRLEERIKRNEPTKGLSKHERKPIKR
jgi:hypothetical protein